MPSSIDTLIYVDIDGVLNVGIRDGCKAPLVLNEANVEIANAYQEGCPEEELADVQNESVAKVASAAEHFGEAVCNNDEQCSDLLVQRLVDILQAGSGRHSVVLSSNWRRSKYSGMLEQLEHSISQKMGQAFEFHDRTEVAVEVRPGDRLRSIGRHVAKHFAGRGGGGAPLRVLVIDDFFATGMSGWSCDGFFMNTAQDVEEYLQACAPPRATVYAKLLHCYDEWTTTDGLFVQAGVGLSEEDVEEATAFLHTRSWSWSDLSSWSGGAKTLLDKIGACDAGSGRQTKKEAAVPPALCWAGVMSLSRLVCLTF